MPKEPKPPQCLECGTRARLTDGRAIYPHRPDLWAKPFWLCACGAYTGCHDGTEHPKGRPAGDATRKARMAAHAAFDPLWRKKMERDGCSKTKARAAAYKWLAEQLSIHPRACHIGNMRAEQAIRVTEICRGVGRSG